MQLFKHMEVVVMLAFGILCATVALGPASTSLQAGAASSPATVLDVDASAPMPTVHVVGRRLTPAEKTPGAAGAG